MFDNVNVEKGTLCAGKAETLTQTLARKVVMVCSVPGLADMHTQLHLMPQSAEGIKLGHDMMKRGQMSEKTHLLHMQRTLDSVRNTHLMDNLAQIQLKFTEGLSVHNNDGEMLFYLTV